ncbi:MAG: adenylate/guanylate cyclase domain-containing protein [Candidatus Omnitrophica bacterium]|nr:adenylate/guanylate cyclase domain-containing protein [Candidatus Omnitrophota bacterium]
MLRKIGTALAAGLVTFSSLKIFPYFPLPWTAALSGMVMIIAFFQLRAALVLGTALCAITIAYHSPGLFVLFTVFAFIAGAVFGFGDHPATFLVLLGSPALALFSVGPFTLPLEFVSIFFFAGALYGRRVAAAAATACLWCSAAGIIGMRSFMGNVVIGPPFKTFFFLKTQPVEPYDFAWLLSRFDLVVTRDAATAVGRLFKLLLGHPVILVQTAGWALAAYALFFFLELRISKNKRLFHVLGLAAAVGVLIAVQFAALAMQSKVFGFEPLKFIVSLIVAAPAFFVYWEWQYASEAQAMPERIQPSPTDVHALLQRENLRRKELSLEDAMKMQSQLKTYMEKKFVKETTALDIDVADSAQLKSNETPEDVVRAFSDYWKLVDLAVLSEKGRLLNRAGDGAIYLFGNANEAVRAARAILRNIAEFNRRKNTLKSPFKIRVGMNTGEIIEDPNANGGDVFSQALDIAGHLQKMAGHGKILISENTYKKINTQKDFVSKGISEKDQIGFYEYQGD